MTGEWAFGTYLAVALVILGGGQCWVSWRLGTGQLSEDDGEDLSERGGVAIAAVIWPVIPVYMLAAWLFVGLPKSLAHRAVARRAAKARDRGIAIGPYRSPPDRCRGCGRVSTVSKPPGVEWPRDVSRKP